MRRLDLFAMCATNAINLSKEVNFNDNVRKQHVSIDYV